MERAEDESIVEKRTKRSFVMDPVLTLALTDAKQTGVLHLSYFGLQMLPGTVISIAGLVRLDVGHNDLRALPKEVGGLKSLEELWVNGNKNLDKLPEELSNCTKLRSLDARGTALHELPASVCTLQHLSYIDLREIETLEQRTHDAYFVVPQNEEVLQLLAPSSDQEEEKEQDNQATHVDTPEGTGESIESRTIRLKSFLQQKHEIREQINLLQEKLMDGLYRNMAETEEGRQRLTNFTGVVAEEFDDLSDLRDVVRNCDRLFPEKFSPHCIPKMKARFLTLKQQNERKKLAAKLELKLRTIYFDRIDPTTVEGIVKSIYAEVESLGDIKFLLRYAKHIFPEDAQDIRAYDVALGIKGLQQEFAEQRDAAIAHVTDALIGLYAHIEPPQVEALSKVVCKHFREIDDIKKLAADASMYFPAEFETAATSPETIRQNFVAVNLQDN